MTCQFTGEMILAQTPTFRVPARRCIVLVKMGAALIVVFLFDGHLWAAEGAADVPADVSIIADPVIRAGVEAAISENLVPAATEKYYPGYFSITADGGDFGDGATWPGLDSWQMAGAYLLIGRTRLVLDYFEFVRASQRRDGAIPFAIFTGTTNSGGYLRGLKSPQDIFSYDPPRRQGLPDFSQTAHTWIGLFEHWQPKADPLTTLGSVCYILTASEIFAKTRSQQWLKERLPSLASAATYLLAKKSANGLIAGSGFYTELPPRYAWDGVTQCYVIHAFRELARLEGEGGERATQARWLAEADALNRNFTEKFWVKDHFGEYINPEHGLVDSHGLSDVNWAAVAFDIVQGPQLQVVWRRLMTERGFWVGNMPTQTVTRPFSYEIWELNERLPFELPNRLTDVSAMGRVWYLEAKACVRMKASDRLLDSARAICKAAPNGYWRERYHANRDGTVTPAGAEKYCEYPAVLVRVVLGTPGIFLKSH